MIPAMKELFKWHKHHKKNGGEERLGQFFWNTYCKPVTGSTQLEPEDETLKGIFYADDKKAMNMIQEWLINNQHMDELPKPLRPVEHFSKTFA